MYLTREPTPPFQGTWCQGKRCKVPKEVTSGIQGGGGLLVISFASALPDAHPPVLGVPGTDLPAPPAHSDLALKGSRFRRVSLLVI